MDTAEGNTSRQKGLVTARTHYIGRTLAMLIGQKRSEKE